jgi:hypothetical protein
LVIAGSRDIDQGATRTYPWDAKYNVSRLIRYGNSNVPELGGRYVMRTDCVSASQRASTVCESASPAV